MVLRLEYKDSLAWYKRCKKGSHSFSTSFQLLGRALQAGGWGWDRYKPSVEAQALPAFSVLCIGGLRVRDGSEGPDFYIRHQSQDPARALPEVRRWQLRVSGREGSFQWQTQHPQRWLPLCCLGARCPGAGHLAQECGGGRRPSGRKSHYCQALLYNEAFPLGVEEKNRPSTYHVPKFNGGNLWLRTMDQSPQKKWDARANL